MFIIQGEGMGHTTQAIRLHEIIAKQGHELASVCFGTSSQRTIPHQVVDYFNSKIRYYNSPNFVRSRNRKGILVSQSFVYNMFRIPLYIKSILYLRRQIRNDNPDVVINFYDLLGGLSYYLSSSQAIFYAISHHFLFEHPEFPKLNGFAIQKRLLLLHNRICSLGARKRIALSFLESHGFRNTVVFPPLIRKDILDSSTKPEKFVLVYLLNEGLSADLLPLFKKYNNVSFKIFMQEGLNPEIFPHNVSISLPDYKEFKKALLECSGVITTSGFETICEAAFLEKPVFLIPSENHFEQQGNMEDAKKSGIALSYLSFQPEHLKPVEHEDFIKWCLDAEKMFVEIFND